MKQKLLSPSGTAAPLRFSSTSPRLDPGPGWSVGNLAGNRRGSAHSWLLVRQQPARPAFFRPTSSSRQHRSPHIPRDSQNPTSTLAPAEQTAVQTNSRVAAESSTATALSAISVTATSLAPDKTSTATTLSAISVTTTSLAPVETIDSALPSASLSSSDPPSGTEASVKTIDSALPSASLSSSEPPSATEGWNRILHGLLHHPLGSVSFGVEEVVHYLEAVESLLQAPGAAPSEEEKQLCNTCLELIASELKCYMDHLHGAAPSEEEKQLCNTCLELLASELKCHVDHLHGGDAALLPSVMGMLARRGYSVDAEWCVELQVALGPKLKRLNADGLANVAVSVSMMVMEPQLSSFPTSALAHTIFGLNRMNVRPTCEWLDAFRRAVDAQVDAIIPWELAMILVAYSHLGAGFRAGSKSLDHLVHSDPSTAAGV
eukprot:gene24780-10421_t